MEKVYVVTVGYESFAHDTLKLATAMIECFESAVYVNKEYCNGVFAVPSESQKEINLTVLNCVSKEEIKQMREEQQKQTD